MLHCPVFDRAEVRILHGCARLRLAASEADHLGVLLAEPTLDWAFILEMGARHGLSALMHRHLEAPRFRAHLPFPVQARLKRQAVCVHQRNLVLTAALVEAARLLEAAGVRTLAVKGPTLALQAYGMLGLRPFNDLDLLVTKTDLQHTSAILQRLGYTLPLEEAFTSRPPQNQPALLFSRPGVILEAKTTLDKLDASSGTMNLATYWPARAYCDVGRQRIATLGHDDLLFYLCIHGSIHGWSCLKWLVDLIAFKKTAVDWDAMLARAAEHTGLEAFLLGWYLLRDVFGETLPDALQDALDATPALPRLAQWCAPRWYAPGVSDAFQLHRYRLTLSKGWFRRIRYVSTHLFKPTHKDWAALPFLPPSTPLIFSLYRPVRLCADMTRKMIRRRSGDRKT